MKLRTTTWVVALGCALVVAGCSPPTGTDPEGEQDVSIDVTVDQSDALEPAEDADAPETAGPPVNAGAQQECLVGNWYPVIEEWKVLRSAGLDQEVVHNSGGFVVSIDEELHVTLEAWDLSYEIQGGPDAGVVNEDGRRTWVLQVMGDGAHEARQSLDTTDYRVTLARDGEVEESGAAPYPEVFDEAVLQCEEDTTKVVRPHGQMTLGLEH